MGKNHWKPIKPPHPVDPGHGGDNPPAPGIPLIWWTENEQGRLTPGADGKTDAEKANVGIATLTIQRDNGTLWRVLEDKAPYTWVQVAKGSAGGDPYKDAMWSESFGQLQPWTRLLISVDGPKTVNLAAMNVGDSFEIVDTDRIFDKAPVTLAPSSDMKFAIIDTPGDTLTLDTIGQGATWRFYIVAKDIVVSNVP